MVQEMVPRVAQWVKALDTGAGGPEFESQAPSGGQAVTHTLNPSTQEAEVGGSLSSGPVRSTE